MECNSSAERNVCGGSARPTAGLREVREERGLPARLLALDSHDDASTDSFMSDMDEISYWIHTKRAPCLMNYDNPIKKRNKAQCSKELLSGTEEDRSPKKKKKRKLSIIDDDSVFLEEQQNVYFDSQKKAEQVANDCKSDSLGSDVNFDIKNSSIQEKRKRVKLQKNNQTNSHKKNKHVTSTPKIAVNLRRSLRHNKGVNHSHFNSSYDIFKSSLTNGAYTTNNIRSDKPMDKLNQSEPPVEGDQTVNKKNNNIKNKSKNQPQNGQFDDVSDVSGFTANYIRSTKVQSNKAPRKLRCKSNRNLVEESQQPREESNVEVCMNKPMNTGLPVSSNVLNYSTDSSQNLINLVSNKNNGKSSKIDKITSLLKLVDSKDKCKDGIKVDRRRRKANLNVSFQSQSSATSRYPKRNKRTAPTPNTAAQKSTDKRKCNKNCIDSNNSDKKENPEDKLVSKTRSGRNIGLSVLQRENSVLVVSNSTEPVSSMASVNVASPKLADHTKKKRALVRQGRNKKPTDKVQSLRRDTLRDRSGFAACFSESDDDSEPLIHRKYFCA